MRYAYVLSRGEYSDYRVVCVCPSKREAEALAVRMNAVGDSYDAVRVERLPRADNSARRVEVLSMSADLWDNGTEGKLGSRVRIEWPFDSLFDTAHVPVKWRWVRAPIHRDAGGRLEVSGTDHERVRKVFSDRRAQVKTDDVLRTQREVWGSR